MDAETKVKNRWVTCSPLGEQTLTIDDRGFALHTVDNKVKIDSFPLSELKRIRYEEPSDCLAFYTKKWRLSAICVGGLKDKQRDEIVAAVCSRVGDQATRTCTTNDFRKSCVSNLPIILSMGAFFNLILITSLFMEPSPPESSGRVGRGRAMAEGVMGLTHSFGWTGIVVINLILLAVYLLHSYFQGRSNHRIHSISIEANEPNVAIE